MTFASVKWNNNYLMDFTYIQCLASSQHMFNKQLLFSLLLFLLYYYSTTLSSYGLQILAIQILATLLYLSYEYVFALGLEPKEFNLPKRIKIPK